MASASDLTWSPVSRRWYAHRSEPLMQERFWGCDLPLLDHLNDDGGYWDEGGRDAAGTPVGWRQRTPENPGWSSPVLPVETAEWDGRVRTVRLTHGPVVRTTFDAVGRAVRTDYEGVERLTPGSETYEYDDEGRLVAIDEYDGLSSTLMDPKVESAGGRLVVEHDAEGVCAITRPDGRVRWRRPDGDWETTLAAYADRTSDLYLAAARAARSDALDDPSDRIAALRLVYTEAGGLEVIVMAVTEAEIARKLESAPAEFVEHVEHVGLALLSAGDDLPLNFDQITGGITRDEDEAMFRLACLMDPREPHRVVLGEVARRLALADWTGVFHRTDDFVVYIEEHDQDSAPAFRSIREHNPPERVALWEARRQALERR